MNLANLIDPEWVQNGCPKRVTPVVQRRPAEVSKAEPLRFNRSRQVIELVKARGSVSPRDVATALGITGTNAGVLLLNMLCKGALRRIGERMYYRYALA